MPIEPPGNSLAMELQLTECMMNRFDFRQWSQWVGIPLLAGAIFCVSVESQASEPRDIIKRICSWLVESNESAELKAVLRDAGYRKEFLLDHGPLINHISAAFELRFVWGPEGRKVNARAIVNI